MKTDIGMMPVPKIMLSSLIDKATSIAKDNGIQNIEHYRDDIIKQAAGIAFMLMKDSVLLMKKQLQSLGSIISPGRIHEGLWYKSGPQNRGRTKTCIYNTARIRGKLVTIYKAAPVTNF